MITWGINGNSHNAALAVFDYNQLVFATESERFNRIKNSPDLSDNLISYVKDNWGLPRNIYWYENPFKKTLRQLIAGQGFNWSENNIKKYLLKYNINCPITYVDHHHSHAAAGYFTSKFNDACVVVIDAIGEFDTVSIWSAKRKTLKKLWSKKYPYSIGLFYSAMTQRCRLKPNEEEYILMGMSAFGDANKLKTKVRNLFNTTNLHKGCKSWEPSENIFDIAAATQSVYEELLLEILNHAKQLTQNENLVFMGGCALNCVANSKIGNVFENIWIMPSPDDAGSSIGAVLAERKTHIDFDDTFLGYEIQQTNTDKEIVDYLLTNKICGVARGKAEFGPRALGNRSLIADPRGIDIKDKVNSIKQREEFRPFAPIILEEYVNDYFEMPIGWNTSPFMQVIVKCKYPEKYPAIIHIDNTSRVQTVKKGSLGLRNVLELWYEKTGCPMLLNTSLNIKGQPIVNNEKDVEEFELKHSVKVFS